MYLAKKAHRRTADDHRRVAIGVAQPRHRCSTRAKPSRTCRETDKAFRRQVEEIEKKVSPNQQGIHSVSKKQKIVTNNVTIFRIFARNGMKSFVILLIALFSESETAMQSFRYRIYQEAGKHGADI